MILIGGAGRAMPVSFENEDMNTATPLTSLPDHKVMTLPRQPVTEYAQILRHLPAAVYTCDRDGYINMYNDAAVKLWGRTPELGKDLWCGSWKIWQTDGVTPVSLDTCPMAVALKKGKSVRNIEIIVENPDGTKRHILPHPDPILNELGEVVGAVNMLMDITDLKKSEKALRASEQALRESESKYKSLAAELEKRVVERTEELNEANTQLNRSNKELEQFAFVASHDLKEPLRKIQTFAELLYSKNKDVLNAEAQLYLDKISTSSQRMSRLINGLLAFSLIKKSGNEYEETDLGDVMKNVRNDFEVLIQQKGVSLKVGTLPTIDAIPLQMNQLFFNLIGNALKFTVEGRRPEIEVSSRLLSIDEIADKPNLDSSRAYYEIMVKDNGVGFDPQYAEKIFEIFQRLNARTAYDGTGIGLTVCHKIVHNHNGLIYSKGEENIGANFFVLVPVKQERI